MSVRQKIGVVTLVLGLGLGTVFGAESQRVHAGRSGSPLFDQSGRFMVAYQGAGNVLTLSSGETSSLQGETPLGTSIPFGGPASVFKTDRKGGIGVVWAQDEGGQSGIYFGRWRNDGIEAGPPIATSPGPLFSPDLDFDDSSEAWISWCALEGEEYRICVTSAGSKKTWRINGPFTRSALNPKILAAADGAVWVFWTGIDRERDEIFGAVYRGYGWSEPFRLNGDSRYPHISQAVAQNASGFPTVVWSAYDGSSYEIFASSWDGAAWSPEEKISESAQADTSPGIAFVRGGVPVAAWIRSSGGSSTVCVRCKEGYAWSPEIELARNDGASFRSLKIAARGERIGMTWESSRGIGSDVLSFQELAGKSGPGAAPQAAASSPATPRDPNQYTTFGDSITAADLKGYQPILEPLLRQRYGSAKIYNEGLGGETTVDGLARIDSSISSYPSLYLLLMEGTNDVVFTNISMSTAAFDLEEMCLKSIAAGMAPLLATIIPRNDSYGNLPLYKNRIIDLNTRIRQITTDLKIVLVEQFNAFYNYPTESGGWQSLLFDGVHPNPTGFTLMAQTWFDGVRTQKDVLTLTSPNGGEIWQATTDHSVTWTSQGVVGNVKLEISADGGVTYSEIVASAPNTGTFAWTVPNKPGPNAVVRIVDAVEGRPSDVSDAVFTITRPPKPKPPLNVFLETRLDATETRKINRLVWQTNPENARTPAKSYRIFRKGAGEADSSYFVLASVPGETLQYEDAGLDVLSKYAYRVTTMSIFDDESDPSPTVTETKRFEFPPLNLVLDTVFLGFHYSAGKVNLLMFEKNRLNDAADVSGYRIYRRKAEEGDDAFATLGDVHGPVLRHSDVRLPLDQKFAYAVTTLFSDGRESRRSAVITEGASAGRVTSSKNSPDATAGRPAIIRRSFPKTLT